MRAFLTDMTDRFRPPYGRVVQEFPRRAVFIATSNDDTPIQDAFGRRRYWPVRVENELRRDELEADREQLFAEAVVLFESGEKWWMTKEEELIANEERGLMLEVDAFAEMVMDYVRNLPPEQRPKTVSVPEFLKHKMSMMPSEIVKVQKSAALALRAAGFTKVHMAKGTLWGVPDKVRYFGMSKDEVLGRVK
jgi:predicted P-loop ATPase